MGFNCGIVGLPNVGKSTLFNALTESQAAAAANYPFCTIEPNTGKVIVPDVTLDELAAFEKSAKVVPATLEVVDIAGLVKGASAGEGLGNKFLGHIQAVDCIIHVIRAFIDDDVAHVHGKIDPISDADTINTELMLADLESAEKQIANLEKKARGQDKEAIKLLEIMNTVKENLRSGISVRETKNEIRKSILDSRISNLGFLTEKPVIYVLNVNETDAATGNDFTRLFCEKYAKEPVLIISSKIEMEIAQIADLDERKIFLDDLGLAESGLNKIIKTGYRTLGLETFYTVGPKEAHAWTITAGSTAPQAAGKIHTDFEKGFIRAEISRPNDWLKLGGEVAVKNAGLCRTVGKDYIMQNQDIMNVLFNI